MILDQWAIKGLLEYLASGYVGWFVYYVTNFSLPTLSFVMLLIPSPIYLTHVLSDVCTVIVLILFRAIKEKVVIKAVAEKMVERLVLHYILSATLFQNNACSDFYERNYLSKYCIFVWSSVLASTGISRPIRIHWWSRTVRTYGKWRGKILIFLFIWLNVREQYA